jgi:hypothetical protein
MVPAFYYSKVDEKGKREDHDERQELNYGCYEF